MDVKGVLAILGTPGRFAWIFLGLAYLNFFFVAFNDIFPGIYGATPDHHCRLPDGVTLNGSVPVDERGQFSKCEVFVNYSRESGESQPCPDGWQYTLEEGEATVPTEWDLVCDKKYLNTLSTSLYYLGIVVGSLIFGTLSDRIGRKPVIILCLFAPLSAGILIYFAKSLVVFVALRFVIGLFKQGLQINSFVLAMEQFSSSKQLGLVAGVLETSWSVAGAMLSAIAWAMKDWRKIQLLAVSPCVLALTYFWLIPESLRWQISTGRYSDAEKTIRFAGKINHVNLAKELKGQELKSFLAECEESNTEEKVTYNLLHLIRFTKIRCWTAILCFMWFANSCTSYSLMLDTPELPGNRFLNLGLSMAVEFPAVIFVALFAHRLKRRSVLVLSFGLTGSLCLASAFTPYKTNSGSDIGWLVLAIVCFARFFTSVTWTVLGLITCEIYPTVIRSIGYGVCVFAAKFGSIVAPQILFLHDAVAEWLPLVLLGVFTLLASMMCMLLPETVGTNMPDTIEEAENRTWVIDFLRNKGQKKTDNNPMVQKAQCVSKVSPDEGLNVLPS